MEDVEEVDDDREHGDSEPSGSLEEIGNANWRSKSAPLAATIGSASSLGVHAGEGLGGAGAARAHGVSRAVAVSVGAGEEVGVDLREFEPRLTRTRSLPVKDPTAKTVKGEVHNPPLEDVVILGRFLSLKRGK